MLRGLLDNLGSAVLALLLALMVWLLAITDGNPVQARTFPTDGVAIQVVNIPKGLVLFEPVTQRAYITLRAPSKAWDVLNSGDLVASVDLTGLQPGIHDVEVKVSCARCPQERASTIRVDPARVTVRLEELLEKTMPVQVEVLDRPPQGYTLESAPTTEPPQVKVSGPRSLVDQVVRVVAPLFLQGAKSSIVRSVTILPRDGQGRLVSNVDVAPNIVNVRASVVELRGYKEVSVKPNIEGTPARGYYTSNISVTPSTLTVYGIPVLSDKAPGVLETEPINVTGAKETIERRVAVILPEGITVLGGDTAVQVRIEISAQQGGGSLVIEPTVRGVDPGLVATVTPRTVQVILSGPLPILEGLKPTDVPVLVDVSGRGPGTYKITPIVAAPPSVKVESVVPDTVEVVLAPEPTPTPGPTPRRR